MAEVHDRFQSVSIADALLSVSTTTRFLDDSAAMARAQWTQFSDGFIAVGLLLLAITVVVSGVVLYDVLCFRQSVTLLASEMVSRFSQSVPFPVDAHERPAQRFFILMAALSAVHAVSVFSNSYILAELQVMVFLFGTGMVVYGCAVFQRVCHARERLNVPPPVPTAHMSPWAAVRYVWAADIAPLLWLPLSRPTSEEEVAPKAQSRVIMPTVLLAALIGVLYAGFIGSTAIAVFLFTLLLFEALSVWDSRSSSCLVWQDSDDPSTLVSVQTVVVYMVIATASMVAMARIGGYDRVGANPFDKSGPALKQALSTANSSNTLTERGWIGWVMDPHCACMLAALLVSSLLVHHLHAAVVRLVGRPRHYTLRELEQMVDEDSEEEEEEAEFDIQQVAEPAARATSRSRTSAGPNPRLFAGGPGTPEIVPGRAARSGGGARAHEGPADQSMLRRLPFLSNRHGLGFQESRYLAFFFLCRLECALLLLPCMVASWAVVQSSQSGDSDPLADTTLAQLLDRQGQPGLVSSSLIFITHCGIRYCHLFLVSINSSGCSFTKNGSVLVHAITQTLSNTPG